MTFLILAVLTLGRPFGSSMVLQRDRPVPVWGRADADATVTVSFAGASATATAGADGAWRVELPALKASCEGRDFVVTADKKPATKSGERKVLKDVVVGEVWFFSGQSNMEMSFASGAMRYGDGIGAMVAQVTHKPLVRYLYAPGQYGWKPLTPEFLTSGWRSAIPIHYGLEIHEKLGIPVGVVVAAVGGSNINTWIAANGTNAVNHRARVAALGPLAMRGAVWYQGEANVTEVEAYPGKMDALRRTWADQFENPELPFYFVQLAPFHYDKPKQLAALPHFMEAQARFAERDPHAEITVINDIGLINDIHPGNKWLVSKRLVLHALRRDYGFPNVEDNSPFPESATIVATNRVRVTFKHAKSLYVYRTDNRWSCYAGFELAGEDGVWKKANILNFAKLDWRYQGTVSTNYVDLVAKDVEKPVRVRHAYVEPFTGVLFNQVNLPCGPFIEEVK